MVVERRIHVVVLGEMLWLLRGMLHVVVLGEMVWLLRGEFMLLCLVRCCGC